MTRLVFGFLILSIILYADEPKVDTIIPYADEPKIDTIILPDEPKADTTIPYADEPEDVIISPAKPHDSYYRSISDTVQVLVRIRYDKSKDPIKEFIVSLMYLCDRGKKDRQGVSLSSGFEYISSNNIGFRILASPGISLSGSFFYCWETNLMIPLGINKNFGNWTEVGLTTKDQEKRRGYIAIPGRSSTILRIGAIGYPNFKQKLEFRDDLIPVWGDFELTTRPYLHFFYVGIGYFSYYGALIDILGYDSQWVCQYFRPYMDLIWTIPSLLQYFPTSAQLSENKNYFGFRMGLDGFAPYTQAEFGYVPSITFLLKDPGYHSNLYYTGSSVGQWYFKLTLGLSISL